MHITKETLKGGLRKLGVHVTSTERLGIDVYTDLARLTSNHPIATVFDVGGNFGQTALRFAAEFPEATIYTFEPVPDSFDTLVRAVGNYRLIKPFNLALGDIAGSVTIQLTQSAGSNSIVGSRSALGGVEVKVDTVDAISDQHSIQSIDLLKIDVEGYELQVLKGAGRMLSHGRVRYVYAECAFAKDWDPPHTSFFDLHNVLEKHGFCFVGYYAESFSLKLGCALGNVLYALRSALPERVPGQVRNIF